MNKIRLLLFAVILLPAMILSGQITITTADMPSTGDTIRYSNATMTSVMGIDFTVTGANLNWDFSNLTHTSQDVDTFVSVLNTSILYYPSFLTIANLARKGESVNVGAFSLTNVYDFFHKTNDYYAQAGFAGTLSGFPLPSVYSSRDYHYRFPMNFGDVDSCAFGYSIGIPGLFTSTNQSKRVNTVDGWGTVTTPLGTFQSLRVKSIITSRDSIASDSLPFPLPAITTVTTEYKWLANGHAIPLVTATQSGFGATTVVYADIYRPTTGIEEVFEHKQKPLVYPNPVSGSFSVLTHQQDADGKAVSYQISDLTGRILIQGTAIQVNGVITLDATHLRAGVYMVRLYLPDGSGGAVKMVKRGSEAW
jgi:hypothetical protein